MKIFLTLFVLLFSSSVVAEDISDFQIDGMTVGDSLLDYFSETEIKDAHKNYYQNSDKYYDIVFYAKKNSKYDDYSISVKKNDKDYIIKLVSGVIYFENEIYKCKEHKDSIFKEIISIFSNEKFFEYEYIYDTLADGKSIAFISDFEFKSGLIRMYCIEYSNATKKETGFADSFSIDITTQEHLEWINNEAY